MQGMSTDKVINTYGGIGVVMQHEKLQQDISNLHTYLFDNSSSNTILLVNTEVKNILKNNYNFINDIDVASKVEGNSLYMSISYTTINDNLSTKLEFSIPLTEEGAINYE